MSFHAGAFFFDGRPIGNPLLDGLRRAAAEFGPDGCNEFVEPGLALLHGSVHVNSEDSEDRQPRSSTRGNVITFSGRLDNRDDLIFQFWDELRAAPSDSLLALASYERWGIDGFARLVGDWSLSIWDRSVRSVVLATDYMGVRPLYFHVSNAALTWSSTLHTLVELHSLHHALDDSYVVGYLSRAMPPHLTPYRGIARVMAAHCMVTKTNESRSVRYWDFPSHTFRYASSQHYESALRQLFVDGVKQRLRARAPVWSQLSGGLDSSSIVCAADALVKTGAVKAPSFETVGYITDGSPETDERRFMAAVDGYTGRQTHLLQLDGATGSHRYAWVTPAQISPMLLKTFALLARHRSSVLLTGIAGDSVLGNFLDYHYDVAAHLGRGHIGGALSLARRRALADKNTFISVLRRAFMEFAPAQLWMSSLLGYEIRASGGNSLSDEALANLYLVKPQYVGPIRAEWSRQLRRLRTFPNVAVRRPMRHLIAVAEGGQARSPSEVVGVDTTHPYLHRPLVEFAMSIPMEVLVPPGDARGLMRRAFETFVPPRIIRRFSKGYASPFVARAGRNTCREWLAQPNEVRLLSLDCIDSDRLMRYLRALCEGSTKHHDFIGSLTRLEQWLRSREGHIGMCVKRVG